MNKILKHILIHSVLIIIILHSIIPHPHSDELTEKEHANLHNKSGSLIGVIKLVFHESNDESLDNIIYAEYGNEKGFENSLKHPRCIVSEIYQFFKSKVIKFPEYDVENLQNICFVKTNGERAPPSMYFYL